MKAKPKNETIIMLIAAIVTFVIPFGKRILHMPAYEVVILAALLAVFLGYADGAASIFSLLNIRKIWLTRPYSGPEVVVEVIGADLNRRANRAFDRWSRPDTYVTLEHGQTERRTQVEGNTYAPRFLWKSKMPYWKTTGMRFAVVDANVLRDDEVMGRAFLDREHIQEMMRTMEPSVLSLGENIGILKVMVTAPPADLKKPTGPLALSSATKRLDTS